MRRQLGRAGQVRVAVLLALALFVRALVPAGWMPVATADGLTFELCPSQASAPRAMARHHGGADHGKAEHGKAAPEQPCAFAGLGVAADTTPYIPLLAPAPFATTVATACVPAVAVGRGLAAPPPPATGPPTFA